MPGARGDIFAKVVSALIRRGVVVGSGQVFFFLFFSMSDALVVSLFFLLLILFMKWSIELMNY